MFLRLDEFIKTFSAGQDFPNKSNNKFENYLVKHFNSRKLRDQAKVSAIHRHQISIKIFKKFLSSSLFMLK